MAPNDPVRLVNAEGQAYDADNPLPVVGTLNAGDINIGNVDVVSVVPGTSAANLAKAEDAAHASGDVGVMSLAVRKDTPAAVAADGDYIPLLVDALGRLWANIASPFTPVGSHSSGASISSAATLTAPAGATKLFMQALTQNVRYTIDGTTSPTASLGFQLKAESSVFVETGPGGVVKVIQEAATASLQYQWGK